MLRPIRTDSDYEAALARAAELMSALPGTPQTDELDVLATLIERYEDEQAPLPPPDPIDAILFRLEQSGRPTQDLRDILGVTRSRVSELLNRKRRLSLDMIRTLSDELDIPADVLVQTEAVSTSGRGPRSTLAARRPHSDRRASAARESAPSLDAPGGPLPDLVRAHLRADRNLDPTAADLLGEMFRAAYHQVAGTTSDAPANTEDGASDGPV